MPSLSAEAAAWSGALRYADLPSEIIAGTKLRILDSLGLMLVAGAGEFGARIGAAVAAMGSGDESTIIGSGHRTSPGLAALANGALAEALQFDDTHNETIVHVSSPNVAAAFAAAEATGACGRDLLTAITAGSELTCRIGLVAPGQFHGRGLHPTGIFGALGATYAVTRLLGFSVEEAVAAVGHAGSFASGILACWEDGTDTQFLHPGWSAHAALAAASFARAGLTGPERVLEGRFGLFAAHVQGGNVAFDFERMTRGLGTEWESRRISFKPYPAVHVIHSFLDALLYLYHAEGLRARDVAGITVRIAPYMIPVGCEPVAEKTAPRTPAHARVSLQYSLAEAMVKGRLSGDAYQEESIRDPEILDLARRVVCEPDPDAPGTERYKGWIIVETTDGRRLERVEEHNWGSPEKPMTAEDVYDKFRANAAHALPADRIDEVIAVVASLEGEPSLDRLISLCHA